MADDFRIKIDKYFEILVGFILNKSKEQASNKIHSDTILAIRNHLDKCHSEEATAYYLEKLQQFSNLQLNQLQNKQGIEYLKQNIINWKNYKLFLGLFIPIYQPLNYKYQLTEKNRDTIANMGYRHFKENFSQDIADKLNSYLFDEMEKERKGQQIESILITEIVNLYYQLDLQGIVELKTEGSDKRSKERNTDFNFFSSVKENTHQYYIDHFERKMLSNLNSIYENKLKNEWIRPTPEYVTLALKSIQEEEQRAQQYYNYSMNKVKKLLDKIIIEQQAQNLVNHEKGVLSMLDNNRTMDLFQIYQLFSRIPQLSIQEKQEQPNKIHPFDLIAGIYQKFVEEKLKIIEQNTKKNQEEKKKAQGQGQPQKPPTSFIEDSAQLIEQLIDVITSSDKLIRDYMGNELIFQKARDNSFRNFLNQNKIYARMLSACCDFDFRKGINQKTVEYIDQRQKQILLLYSFLNYKDIFLNDYQKQFQGRNIRQGLSLSLDAELKLVTMLKTETGPTKDIRKLQQMIQDLVDSRDTYKSDFTKYQKDKMIKLPQFYNNSKFLILSHNCWNVNMMYKVTLPEQLVAVSKPFESYFLHKYPDKTLFWIAQDSVIEIQNEQEIFTSKKLFNFTVTLEQYILFHIIEKFKNNVTIQQILNSTQSQMDPSNVYSQLAYLISQQILTRSNTDQQQPKDQFDLQEVIKVNLQYDNQRKQVIFSNFGKAKPVDQNKNPEEDPEIKIQREYIVDSCVVIIMKSRKQLLYNDLIDETVNMIKFFKAQPALIKKRVESLMERQYLKRDENNKLLMVYVP